MKKTGLLREYFLYLAAVASLMVCTPLWASSGGLPDFTDLVEQVRPAVVNISSTQKIRHARPVIPHGKGPGTPFDDLFRHFFGDENGGRIQEFYDKSLGSGFIISRDGYVLTNNHVVDDAEKVVVKLADKRQFVAKIIGADKRSDIALLKIDAADLPVAKIGDANKLRVGEWVLAIGSPFGFDYSVTAGIVSAKARSLPNENYVPFIQTDVAINPGNSGGPLLNLDGEVVGINSQIYSRTGGFMGLSFAIPINVAMNAAEQLKAGGHVVRGWLGILIQDVTRELAESFGMNKPVGALVARVLPDSPAEEAGLKVGDIIVKYDHEDVNSSSSLPPMVGATKVGNKVPVEIIRNGKSRTLEVKIRELPADEDLSLSGESGATRDAKIKRLNILVANLTDEQKAQLDKQTGISVAEVKPGPATRAGIRQGDIILKFNNQDVTDIKQFRKLVKDTPENKPVPVLIQRRGSPIFLAIKISGDD